MGFSAKVLADSVSPAGHRLTTLEVTVPRIVLAEFNTHRMFSRSSASSRAIPVEKRIAMVEEDPFIPEAFGRNQRGMQASEVLDDKLTLKAREIWLEAARDACAWISKHAQNNRLSSICFAIDARISAAIAFARFQGIAIYEYA